MRRLFSSLGLLLALNLLTKPLWILAEMTVQNALGTGAWGLYSALFYSYTYLMAPLADPGLNQFTTRTLAATPDRYALMGGGVLTLKLWLALVYLTVTLAGGLWLVDDAAGYALLSLCALTQVATAFLMYLRGVLQAHHLFGLDGVASVLDKCLLMAFIALALTTTWGSPSFDVVGYAAVALATMVVSVGVVSLVVWRKVGWPMWRRPKWGEIQALMRGSLPFALMIVLFSTNERLNQLLVKSLAGDAANGLFAGAFRWFGAFSMYLWTVLPLFYVRFARQERDPVARQQATFDTAQVVSALPMLYVAGVAWLHADRLFFLFNNLSAGEVAVMAAHLRIQAVALALNGTFNVYSTYLTATGREGYVNALLAAAILVGAAVNLVGIPLWGPEAASWSLAAAFTLLSAGYVWVFTARTPLRPPGWVLARLGLAAGAGFAAMLWLDHFDWFWLGQAGVGGGVTLGAAAALRLFRFRGEVMG